MHFQIDDLSGIRVIACDGSLILGAGAEDLIELFRRELGTAGRGIVLDLTLLTYLDSAGVGAVVSCWKHASASGAVLKVALATSGPVRRIFEITQLERGFEIFEDAASAAASFGT